MPTFSNKSEMVRSAGLLKLGSSTAENPLCRAWISPPRRSSMNDKARIIFYSVYHCRCRCISDTHRRLARKVMGECPSAIAKAPRLIAKDHSFCKMGMWDAFICREVSFALSRLRKLDFVAPVSLES